MHTKKQKQNNHRRNSKELSRDWHRFFRYLYAWLFLLKRTRGFKFKWKKLDSANFSSRNDRSNFQRTGGNAIDFHPCVPRGTMATQTRIKHGLVGMEGIVSIGYYFRVLRNRACANKESDIINEQDKCISMRMYLPTYQLALL